MIINGDTKISAILKSNPAALEVIVGLSPDFEKLRNPLLRRIMAAKATVSMASKIAGCSALQFAEYLRPLGFEFQIANGSDKPETTPSLELPSWIRSAEIRDLDVRPILSGGVDPFKTIMAEIKMLRQGQVLRIINTFEPLPLIAILEKQGFKSHTVTGENKLVETYFFKEKEVTKNPVQPETNTVDDDWNSLLNRFEGKIRTTDVRNMEMPMPMMTILSELENLGPEEMLFVHHKRVPIFLLPELREKKFEYRIREISDNETELLIFRY